jgi:hypothetical protein
MCADVSTARSREIRFWILQAVDPHHADQMEGEGGGGATFLKIMVSDFSIKKIKNFSGIIASKFELFFSSISKHT